MIVETVGITEALIEIQQGFHGRRGSIRYASGSEVMEMTLQPWFAL
jgi:hypothetical protein